MRLKPRDGDIVWETVEGELLLIDLLHGVYYSARWGTAQLVSDLMHGHTPSEAVLRWQERFPQEPVEAGTAEGLAAYLTEKGLASLGSTEPTEPAPFLELTERGFPAIECYEDMKEIFEMDPIHEGDLEQGWPVRA